MTSRPTVINSNTITEIVSDFEGTRLVTSNCITNGNTGEVNIYTYNKVNNTWSSPVTINGPSTNSYFGVSIDVNWDGTRIAVGANALSRVYVYDYSGGSWSYNSNLLQSDSNSDFGFSVSISKDEAKTLAVGAPIHNNVYIYEMLNDVNWTVSNVLNGNHIENIVANNSTSNLILNSTYNRYGESIKLSGFGDHIIVGQPGTILSNIFSSDATNFSIIPSDQLELDGSLNMLPPWFQIGEYYNYFPQTMVRQEGSVQVFKTNSTWHESNTQVGTTLYGERNCTITDESRLGEGAWSPSGFGLNTDISLDGTFITIAAPLFSINGGDYQTHNGKMYSYTYNSINDSWEYKNNFIGDRQGLLGLSFNMDYVGGRMSIFSRNHKGGSSFRVLDWNGTDWYDVKPINYLGGSTDFNKTYISNGNHVFIKRNNSVFTYDYDITQLFSGNSLFSGYVSTPQIFVGTNDGDVTEDTDMPNNSKIISFGGTFGGENSYNSTTVENRVYASYGGTAGQYAQLAGRSELLLAKTNSDTYVSPQQRGWGVDQIRLKSAEIRLDSHDYITQTDNKYNMNPVFVMNYRGHIGIKIPEVEPYDAFFRSRTRTKADLDVNGSVYMRNKLTLNYTERSNLLNKDELPAFWDTRNIDIVQPSNKVYSNIFTNGFYSTVSTLSGSVSYSPENFAFLFSGSTGQLKTDTTALYVYSVLGFGFSFWIKLIEEHNSTNYPGSQKIITLGPNDNSTNASVSLTPTGVEIDFNNGACTFSNTVVFSKNTWYHVFAHFPTNNVSPETTNCSLRLNDNLLTLTKSGSTTTDYDGVTNINNAYITLGGGISSAYVGMITFGRDDNRNPSSTDWYNYGPPDEVLAVGGGATITGKLGVGVTNPTEALEVSGNATISGTMTASSFSGSMSAGNITGTLPVANGGTGVTTSTGTGSVVLSSSPTFNNTMKLYDTTGSSGRSFYMQGDFEVFAPLVTNTAYYGQFTARRGNFGTGSLWTFYAGVFNEGTNASVFWEVVNRQGTRVLCTTYNNTVGIRTSSPSSSFALDVNGGIRCVGAVNTSSDLRIKKNVVDIEDNSALDIVRLIKPKTYEYIDPTDRTSDPVYGFIAQDVEEVLPYAVTRISDKIPNVLKTATISNMDTLIFDTTGLSSNTKLFLTSFSDDEIRQKTEHTVTILEIIDTNSLKIDKNITGVEAFVYGTVVDDFCVLNKSVIWTVATAALQEVDRQLQGEKAKVSNLEAQLASVLARLDALEATSQ